MSTHKPPKYWAYEHGTFASITKCKQCGSTALYEDQHPVNPCKSCGGPVKEAGAAKWVPPATAVKYTYKWGIIPVKTNVTTSVGYWESAR